MKGSYFNGGLSFWLSHPKMTVIWQSQISCTSSVHLVAWWNLLALQLSTTLPHLLILGMVKSVEDHGYVFNFGIHPLSGFLPEQEACKATLSRLASSTSQSKKKWSVVQGTSSVCLNSVNCWKRSHCYSLLDSSTVLDEGSRISSLTPGTLVSGSTTAIGPKGLVLDQWWCNWECRITR